MSEGSVIVNVHSAPFRSGPVVCQLKKPNGAMSPSTVIGPTKSDTLSTQPGAEATTRKYRSPVGTKAGLADQFQLLWVMGAKVAQLPGSFGGRVDCTVRVRPETKLEQATVNCQETG